MSKMKKDIIIAGVGGQGNIFAGAVICSYAIEKGYNVAGTETIGAAQRGGSVVSHIRIADGPIHSPLIPAGTADVLVGMECLELLRNFHMLGPNGWYLLNLYRVPTVYTNLGIDRYPTMEEIFESLNLHDLKGVSMPATAKAVELGSSQITNMVLLGVRAPDCGVKTTVPPACANASSFSASFLSARQRHGAKRTLYFSKLLSILTKSQP